MTRFVPGFLLFATAFAGGVACTGPETDLFSIQGVVIGAVRDASGAPVAQATVRGTATYPLGGGPSMLTDSARTGPQGAYALHFVTGNLADARVPLALTISPPPGSGLHARDTSGLAVLIARGAPPRETTYVNIVLSTP